LTADPQTQDTVMELPSVDTGAGPKILSLLSAGPK